MQDCRHGLYGEPVSLRAGRSHVPGLDVPGACPPAAVRRATPPGGVRRFRLAILAAVGAGASLALAGELTFLAIRGSPAQTTTAFQVLAVIVGGIGLLVAALLARKEEAVRRHGERVQLLVDPGIDTLDDEAVLDALAHRLRDAVGADRVAVVLQRQAAEEGGDAEAGQPAVAASVGLPPREAGVVDPGSPPPVAATPPRPGSPPLPPGWPAAGTTVSVPVTGGGRSEGTVFVGWSEVRPVPPDEERLAALAAGRVWSVLHRRRLVEAERRSRQSAEGARRQLALLAYGGAALGSALDRYDDEVTRLAEVCVPAYADFCAIHLVDAGGRLVLAAARAAPGSGLSSSVAAGWDDLLQGVLIDGRPRFGFAGAERPDDDLVAALLEWLGASSAIVVPVQAGGLALGAVTMATASERRGFRPSDVAVVEELAGRLAVAVQRVLLHGEAVASAEAQARSAQRLRRLTEAAITLAGTAEPERLIDAAAAEAPRVIQGTAGLVVFRMADGREHWGTCGPVVDDELAAVVRAANATSTRVARSGCLAVPLLDASQRCRGVLAVAQRRGADLDVDDEAVLVSLAHLVALVMGRAELTAAVAVREARMLALVEASPLAILRLSPAGDVLDGNAAARALFGWAAGASTGPLPESLAEDLLKLAATAAEGEATRDAEVQGEGPGGELLDLSVAAAPVDDGNGRVDAVLLVVSDVSERRQAQRQLEQAHRLEAMGQVAGGVAHDFNNLLTVIVGYTEALLGATDADDPTRPLLESIERAGASAAALTHQLLGLAGRRESRPVPVEPGRLVQGLDAVVRRLVGVDVEVVIDTAPTRPVVVDPADLEQVVLNLVINARDAMPRGGRLVVSVGTVEIGAAEAEVHRLEPGPHVELTVADTGTGMDPQTLDRCFEPFFTTKERGRGTGLGLAAVYATATDSGGAVHVSSRPGEGTVFRLWLPCTDAPLEPAVVAEDEWPVGTGRVLLVEDEEEIRELARRMLERTGFTVVAAADGADALAAFDEASAPFDVLVSDIVMPGLRGTELADRLRRRQPSLEVLYVSGYTGAGPQAGESINGVGVLRKPFRGEELCRRVVRLAEAAQGSKR